MNIKTILRNGLVGTSVFLVLLAMIPYIVAVNFLGHHMYIRGAFLVVYEIPMIYISALRIIPSAIEMLGVSRNNLREDYENELWGTTAASLIFSLIITLVIFAVW